MMQLKVLLFWIMIGFGVWVAQQAYNGSVLETAQCRSDFGQLKTMQGILIGRHLC